MCNISFQGDQYFKRFLFVLVSDQKRTVNTVSFMYNKDSSTIISVVGHAKRLRMIGPLLFFILEHLCYNSSRQK